jgi:hypothetical protein
LETAVTRRKTWSRDRADTYDLRLIVRCQDRRILGVGMGEPAPIIPLDEALRLPIRLDEDGQSRPAGGRFLPDRPSPLKVEFGRPQLPAEFEQGRLTGEVGDARLWVFHVEVLDGTTLGPGPGSEDWGPTRVYECPNHRAGHQIVGERLRSAIYRLCRPGKVANVDVRDVECVAASGF